MCIISLAEDASYDEFLLFLGHDTEYDMECESNNNSCYEEFLEYLVTLSGMQVGTSDVTSGDV